MAERKCGITLYSDSDIYDWLADRDLDPGNSPVQK